MPFFGTITTTLYKIVLYGFLLFLECFWHKGSRTNKPLLIMKNKIATIYEQADRFAEITKVAIITGNINRAKKCLVLAERLFETGSNETKIAISNVYVFSVSTFMELRHCSISNLFPKSLKAEYIKQINASGV
jgi:hypothetical protein